MATLEHKKVKLVSLKLKSGASTWWDPIQGNRHMYGKKPITSWPKILKLMKHFLPANHERLLHNQFQHSKQGA